MALIMLLNPLKFDTNHNIVSDFIIDTDHDEEVNSIDDLDFAQQQKIRDELEDANKSIRKATKFLERRPQDLADRSYNTTFDRGNLDEHGADQYLFKLGCAIIDRKLKRINE